MSLTSIIFGMVMTFSPVDASYQDLVHVVDNQRASWLKPLGAPHEKYSYVKVPSVASPITDDEIIYEAIYNCRTVKPEKVDRKLLQELLDAEHRRGVPNSLRGMTLAAACSESGYNPKAKGDRKFSKSKKKPMAIGMFQLWPIYEKMYPGLSRTDPVASVEAWLDHIIKKIPKVKRQCKFKREKKIWVAAWVTGIRYKKKGGRCYEKPRHLRVLKRWHKSIINYRKDAIECAEKENDGCGC
jgi:hypothetical protein